ncbi:GntR family transcriptional regulator [Photobacterium sp. BZF1]|uniref:GntR family transcriptional regulator n=1 Tax=Photobacterium sp. BZF1 TaxID=1904457 RepID=UPI001653ECB0|nr:GntR family transcriptional regulator [Photobacterium sp. BZF1]MBC7004163.1 GntR family transcriptional regulator [Photobacterium sp. BZF1]
MSKYKDIYQQLKARIDSGQYCASEKLPEGKKLAAEFGCSEITLKKAMDILVKEGIVVRKRGSGSFIKSTPPQQPDTHLQGTKLRYEGTGKTVTTKVMRFRIVEADVNTAELVCGQLGDHLYEIVRVRSVDDQPTIIEYTYMPVTVVPGLTLEQAEDSIYGYITDTLKQGIHSANLTITIDHADEQESQWLAISGGEHLVNVSQRAYLDNGQLFEHSVAKHTCESFKLSTTYVKSVQLK